MCDCRPTSRSHGCDSFEIEILVAASHCSPLESENAVKLELLEVAFIRIKGKKMRVLYMCP